ncbi:Abi family protein [Sphingobacterium oryzagri]|uniref:Abi family protein n=1 Tax=Sphingobacterium oryzagri TaxID=3025669 RepID=A0ABY7WBW7_9SPHI|nr:Abi family protein [Sphingobacterium sp. KACC 22765]WDF67143.1 Abi family protein [Sphingobacterium sp. KACC 22765]
MLTPLPIEQRAQGELFLFYTMPRVPYAKPATTYAEQLQRLADRGLKFSNISKSLFLLQNISYYRLSGYWYPLLDEPKDAHIFKKDSTFDMAFSMYCFDRELRKLVIAELEKIEIAIRAKMIYILSYSYGTFWYSQSKLFSNAEMHSKSIKKLKEEFDRSDEQFLKSFKRKYNDPLPPSWMLLEITSIGGLSHLYKNLKPGRSKRDIANYYGLDTTTFESWLHSIVYVRNICAHHARLWNRIMRITPVIPTNPGKTWLTTLEMTNSITGESIPVNNRTYYLLSMVIYLLQVVNPNHTFKNKIIDLLVKYPNIDTGAMGFPSNWMEEALWQ